MAAVPNTVSTTAPTANNSHRSLQEIIQTLRQTGETPECDCHMTDYSEGDLPRSKLSYESKDFLKAVETFPLVVEKSVAGVGQMRMELWGTSAAALTSSHVKLVLRLENGQIKAEDGPDPDPVLDLAYATPSAEELRAVKAQLRKGTPETYIIDDVQELLEHILLENRQPE
ncbi:hypothetical protein A1O1_02459 [Capronia coronata CBS 617.96]|uniref:Uncharacterized protein n=1 Tax=Capronia coronata CBS 617.96 TaxID=1182541 RepID=W9YXR8_9EURO|nr:uncharacterized protein A1O1_02459 [Capronia coronata CBS 617.96]EXJ94066.1 hypothetical protein A1O1_02459 [Capronia coronata CBS 617.96]